MQTLTVELESGECVYSESGAMGWMSENIEMKSEMKGGIGSALGRVFSGESLFIVNYTATGSKGVVTFASDFPGKILEFDLAGGQKMICQKDSFFVAQMSVKLRTHFKKRLGVGLFGGEGFILQEIEGPGKVFVTLDGEITEMALEDGQILKVDPGSVAIMEPSVRFDIDIVKGVKNILFGGEGLFLATLKGPGKIWLQSMPIPNLAGAVSRYIKVKGK